MRKKNDEDDFKQRLNEVVDNFVKSETSRNLQAVITTTAKMCEHLYGIIMGFVDMAKLLYRNTYTDAQIHKFLTVLPEDIELDDQFVTIF